MEPNDHKVLPFNPVPDEKPDFCYFKVRPRRFPPDTPEEQAAFREEMHQTSLRLKALLTELLAKHLLPFRPPGSK